VGVVLGKAAHAQQSVYHHWALAHPYDQVTSKNSTW
jgi:hypothetical protein